MKRLINESAQTLVTVEIRSPVHSHFLEVFMDTQDTSKKGSKQTKQSAQEFQEPPSKAVREVSSEEQDEEAGAPTYDEPTTEGEFGEEAAAPEMQTTAFGVDESLLQLKR